jgi:hypothetical protein
VVKCVLFVGVRFKDHQGVNMNQHLVSEKIEGEYELRDNIGSCGDPGEFWIFHYYLCFFKRTMWSNWLRFFLKRFYFFGGNAFPSAIFTRRYAVLSLSSGC